MQIPHSHIKTSDMKVHICKSSNEETGRSWGLAGGQSSLVSQFYEETRTQKIRWETIKAHTLHVYVHVHVYVYVYTAERRSRIEGGKDGEKKVGEEIRLKQQAWLYEPLISTPGRPRWKTQRSRPSWATQTDTVK